MLRHEWKEAVMLILQPRNGEREPMASARVHFAQTGDADAALYATARPPKHT